MQRNLWVPLAVLLVWTLSVASSTGAFADTTAPPVRVAIVDVKEIDRQYIVPQTVNADVADDAKRGQRYLEELKNNYIYLSEEAFNDIIEIFGMTRPLPAEAARRQRELRDVNDKIEERYLALQAKVDRTAGEQDEFSRLQTSLDARKKQIQGIRDELQKRLDEQQASLYSGAMQSAQNAIVQVATENGFHLVFARGALLYGGEDITALVIEKLTGKPVTPAAESPPAEVEPGGGE